ncbi:MAG: hypothetical protein LW625_06245 [Planctomycetaceae bacterium]|jgi:hypothetical protein|nr:hypothetical protein [Planctomycetaceae bacterium]
MKPMLDYMKKKMGDRLKELEGGAAAPAAAPAAPAAPTAPAAKTTKK